MINPVLLYLIYQFLYQKMVSVVSERKSYNIFSFILKIFFFFGFTLMLNEICQLFWLIIFLFYS